MFSFELIDSGPAGVPLDVVFDADDENVPHHIFKKLSRGPTDDLSLVTAICIEQRHWLAADFVFRL